MSIYLSVLSFEIPNSTIYLYSTLYSLESIRVIPHSLIMMVPLEALKARHLCGRLPTFRIAEV